MTKILSPFGAADLTPYAQQLASSGADAAFVAWANTTNAAAMWQSLQQQGVAKKMTIITGLANRASYDAIGPLVPGVTLISHYVYTAPHNAANTYLIKWMAKNRHQVPDLFDPDGFVTAQMICRALAKGGTDVVEGDHRPRGVEVPRPEGPAVHPAGGSRDDPADVPGAARPGRRSLRREGAEDHLSGQRPASGHAVQVGAARAGA